MTGLPGFSGRSLRLRVQQERGTSLRPLRFRLVPCLATLLVATRPSPPLGRDLVDHAFPPRRVAPRPPAHGANPFHRPLRANVVRADHEDDALHEAEGVLQHEPLHLAVVAPAPVRSGEEGPADLDLALLCVESVIARRADDAAVLDIVNEEG